MNLVRSEWTKFRSLRSTWLTAAVTVVLGVGVGALSASAQARESGGEGWDPTAASLTSIIVAQLAIGVLGVLVMTAEYATGTIQPSVVAAPRRGRLLAAKAAVLTAAALALGQLIGFASFLTGQAMIAGAGAPHATLDQPGVLRAVIGSGLYLAAVGVLGLGLGAVLRSTAGAIGTLVSVTLVIRLVAQTLPESWREWMGRYWPTAAGENIVSVVPVPGTLGPWQGFAILCGFVAVVVAAGYATFRTRDT
ncbi:ABC transporter permease subunit [Actinophytocola algeriensis]|uniref:ABC-type transport system involved in multi-copper enzyme maturation permease subunit n=1 Tax=Actinophytocola algeriensis TaxID=1768010 RepID=A0A7W7Q245_9PSEU|nr:ABC transporter permease subunit [Actinophytocola algeriensis]MBB4905604.1 ABC-type transport system involved in multi-copper enzyme maturation permease subunit [Actinophytocola algeriensis]MBE1472711.1 ABC-type transport system involved in multi-copper enzyme maturation permease subunit [Actinophytocola algeriensis]